MPVLALAGGLAIAIFLGLQLASDGSHGSGQGPVVTLKPGKYRTILSALIAEGDKKLSQNSTIEVCFTAEKAKAYISLADLNVPKGWKLESRRDTDNGAEAHLSSPGNAMTVTTSTTGDNYTLVYHTETQDGAMVAVSDITYSGSRIGDCST